MVPWIYTFILKKTGLIALPGLTAGGPNTAKFLEIINNAF